MGAEDTIPRVLDYYRVHDHNGGLDCSTMKGLAQIHITTTSELSPHSYRCREKRDVPRIEQKSKDPVVNKIKKSKNHFGRKTICKSAYKDPAVSLG